MISGGRLLRVASVLKASTSVDNIGRRVNTYTDGGTVRADIREGSAQESVYADGVAVVGNWEVRLRWPNVARVGLTELDRLVVRGKTLRINSIINLDEKDRVAVISCSEVT